MLRHIRRKPLPLLAALALCLLPAVGGSGTAPSPLGEVLITGCCPVSITLPLAAGLLSLLAIGAIAWRTARAVH